MLSHFGKPGGLAGLTYCGAPGTLQSACRQPRPPWHCDANREDHMTELDHEVVKPGFVITMLPPWKFTNRCCWLATCLAFYLCILLVKELTKITSPWSYIVHMYILTSELETQTKVLESIGLFAVCDFFHTILYVAISILVFIDILKSCIVQQYIYSTMLNRTIFRTISKMSKINREVHRTILFVLVAR